MHGGVQRQVLIPTGTDWADSTGWMRSTGAPDWPQTIENGMIPFASIDSPADFPTENDLDKGVLPGIIYFSICLNT